MGTSDETTVSERGGVTIPSEIREALSIEAGDKIRWTVEEGDVMVEVVHQREGVFDDFEPMSMGGDGGTAHNTSGEER
ncbi:MULTISPECIES: AbrB/MazE/SpoVT family DNA-binding domain-containing protein [Halomicrobium]|nr:MULTISPECIES: AbrB/MazE/SpoVT family DNA-binding domain-containing protein [Halomicrobium]QCD66271.1 AbrB/MazE/SpoVT family DNA-binding domain-containing protein [Halomicrobium mukohataei]QFR21077.1 AbrB/MazE/SpoVT family DNA-binding domain-containing protein [Halomicrobium sp. ZPS1]